MQPCWPATEPGDCCNVRPVFCSSVALPGPAASASTDAAGCLAQVSYIEFSPDEKYVLSYSSREPTTPLEKAALLVNVFDAQSGAKLRKFEGSIEEFAVGSAANWGRLPQVAHLQVGRQRVRPSPAAARRSCPPEERMAADQQLQGLARVPAVVAWDRAVASCQGQVRGGVADRV